MSLPEAAGFGSLGFDFLTQPHLDDGLTRHSDSRCLFVEFGNHPAGQVHIHPSDLKAGAARTAPVKEGADVPAFFKVSVELLSGDGWIDGWMDGLID